MNVCALCPVQTMKDSRYTAAIVKILQIKNITHLPAKQADRRNGCVHDVDQPIRCDNNKAAACR